MLYNILSLPEEILIQIGVKLKLKSILTLMLVDKNLNKIFNSLEYWLVYSYKNNLFDQAVLFNYAWQLMPKYIKVYPAAQLWHLLYYEEAFEGAQFFFTAPRCYLMAGRINSIELYNYFHNFFRLYEGINYFIIGLIEMGYEETVRKLDHSDHPSQTEFDQLCLFGLGLAKVDIDSLDGSMRENDLEIVRLGLNYAYADNFITILDNTPSQEDLNTFREFSIFRTKPKIEDEKEETTSETTASISSFSDSFEESLGVIRRYESVRSFRGSQPGTRDQVDFEILENQIFDNKEFKQISIGISPEYEYLKDYKLPEKSLELLTRPTPIPILTQTIKAEIGRNKASRAVDYLPGFINMKIKETIPMGMVPPWEFCHYFYLRFYGLISHSYYQDLHNFLTDNSLIQPWVGKHNQRSPAILSLLLSNIVISSSEVDYLLNLISLTSIRDISFILPIIRFYSPQNEELIPRTNFLRENQSHKIVDFSPRGMSKPLTINEINSVIKEETWFNFKGVGFKSDRINHNKVSLPNLTRMCMMDITYSHTIDSMLTPHLTEKTTRRGSVSPLIHLPPNQRLNIIIPLLY